MPGSKPSDPPSIAFSGPDRIARALAGAGHRLLPLDGPATPEVVPRLSVIAAVRDDSGSLLEKLQAARARWPLVDAIVYAPGASGTSVRALLRAGARDVVLQSKPTALLERTLEVLESQQLLPLIDGLAERRVRSSRFEGMLSRSHAMWDTFEICARVAPTDANVLILGETGTGKELLARALHRRSRRTGRFVALNCASLPENLVESELFGHERGAFTGAQRPNRGIFRHANGGTVFLDEIGDMSAAAQRSLLRVIETGSVRPVGASEEVPVDVRVVAATHVALEDAVAAGDFREDLFYRLDVIRLEIPPLRDRPEDAAYLFGHFLKSLCRHYDVERPQIGDDFLQRLIAHPWPGNVRELENFTERIVLRPKRGVLHSRDFARLTRSSKAAEPEGSTRAPATQRIDLDAGLQAALAPLVEDLEKRYLVALLERTRGRMQEAARIARISRRTLQRKLAAHGIDKARFRQP